MFVILQIFFSLKNEQLVAQIGLGLCAGVFLIPYTSLFTAYCSEVVFPLAEGSATGYLFASSQTFGFILGVISITIVDTASEKSAWKVYLVMGLHCILLTLSFLFTFLTKETLNRSIY